MGKENGCEEVKGQKEKGIRHTYIHFTKTLCASLFQSHKDSPSSKDLRRERKIINMERGSRGRTHAWEHKKKKEKVKQKHERCTCAVLSWEKSLWDGSVLSLLLCFVYPIYIHTHGRYLYVTPHYFVHSFLLHSFPKTCTSFYICLLAQAAPLPCTCSKMPCRISASTSARRR